MVNQKTVGRTWQVLMGLLMIGGLFLLLLGWAKGQLQQDLGQERLQFLGQAAEAIPEGAEELARLTGCRCALLKARSPSCGSGVVYDGTFTGRKVPGDGVAAARLKGAGIPVFDEEHWAEFLNFIKEEG